MVSGKCNFALQVVALANLLPVKANINELDSYMYQTVGHQLVASYAQCTNLPLFRRHIKGSSSNAVRRFTSHLNIISFFILMVELKNI